MWAAVRQRFSSFHRDLLITPDQNERGYKSAQRIADSLQRAYYPGANGPPPAFIVGSWGKRTQVRPSQDADMMFVLPPEAFTRFDQRADRKQSGLLQEVKDNLAVTYHNSTLRGDGQVVQIDLDQILVEVVPVFAGNNSQYVMPDTNGGGRWKIVHPLAEMHRIDTSDTTCNGNVRALCQIVKLWCREQNVPLPSFQVELLVCTFMDMYEFRLKDYFYFDWFVRDFFEFLVLKAGGHMFMPGTNEIIWLGDEWRNKAETAYKHAVGACEWERADYDVTAGQIWRKIFGSRITEKILRATSAKRSSRRRCASRRAASIRRPRSMSG